MLSRGSRISTEPPPDSQTMFLKPANGIFGALAPNIGLRNLEELKLRLSLVPSKDSVTVHVQRIHAMQSAVQLAQAAAVAF